MKKLKLKYSWSVDSAISNIRKKGEAIVHKVATMNRYSIGCDPEFFFMKGGKVVGSEEVLKKDYNFERGKLTIDGVQAEINPLADTCRERLMYSVASLITKAHDMAPSGVSISFDPLVPISLTKLNKLSDKAKFFGCTPSFSIYDTDNKMEIQDSSKYPYRPAGGHLHIGHDNNSTMMSILENVRVLIPMLDIIVGNTCVLIDRHDGNKERRKCYGRAGEYRTPKHGIEYRTLSNFWLNGYPLFSFVFGLARMTLAIIASSNEKHDFVREIMEAVDQNDIRNAINNNDFELALANFSKIKPILERILPEGSFALSKSVMPNFLHFVGSIQKKGLKYWFPNPIEYWVGYVSEGRDRGNGWENFIRDEVVRDMPKK